MQVKPYRWNVKQFEELLSHGIARGYGGRVLGVHQTGFKEVADPRFEAWIFTQFY